MPFLERESKRVRIVDSMDSVIRGPSVCHTITTRTTLFSEPTWFPCSECLAQADIPAGFVLHLQSSLLAIHRCCNDLCAHVSPPIVEIPQRITILYTSSSAPRAVSR